MKKIFCLFMAFFVLESCSSKRNLKKPYELMDAKYAAVPEWINEPQEWAEDHDEKDYKTHKYYVFETEPKKRRDVACQIAKAKATAAIAGEITQYIKQSLGQSIHGNPIDGDSRLEEYVESHLAREVQSYVVGASVHRQQWELRKYKKELGANGNYNGYTCAALIKISRDNLRKAVSRAQEKLEKQTLSKDAKTNVKKAMEDVASKFGDA